MKDVDLLDVLKRWLGASLEAVHTCIPASIVTYEGHKTRRAVVQPCVDFRSGVYVVPYGPVAGVPVCFPSTPRFSFLYDLKKGDTGILLVSEAAMGNWLDGDGTPKSPEDGSRFTLNDAIFIPGLFAWNAVPTSENKIEVTEAGVLTLANKGGCTIVMESSKVTVNGNLEVLL